MKTMPVFWKYLIPICLLLNVYGISYGEIGISTNHVAYGEDNESRRLLLEPGTLLQIIGEETSDYGPVYVVRTPTGIKANMRKRHVEVIEMINQKLSVVKETKMYDGILFQEGQIHPYKKVQSSGKYRVNTGLYKYNPRQGKYLPAEPQNVDLSPEIFNRIFNKVTPDSVASTKFFKWEPLKFKPNVYKRQKWGCRVSYELIDFLNVEAMSETKAEFGFWKWFQQKFRGNIEIGTERKRKISRVDNKFLHQMTFWDLKDDQGKIVSQVVIDKLTECPGGSTKISYHFEFPGGELAEFDISHDWINWKDDYIEGDAPITLSTLEHYRKLEIAFKKSGFFKSAGAQIQYADHLRDLIIMIVASVIPPPH